jgi:hypothetical protein
MRITKNLRLEFYITKDETGKRRLTINIIKFVKLPRAVKPEQTARYGKRRAEFEKDRGKPAGYIPAEKVKIMPSMISKDYKGALYTCRESFYSEKQEPLRADTSLQGHNF